MQIKNLPLDFIKLKRPSEGIENQKLSTFQNIDNLLVLKFT